MCLYFWLKYICKLLKYIQKIHSNIYAKNICRYHFCSSGQVTSPASVHNIIWSFFLFHTPGISIPYFYQLLIYTTFSHIFPYKLHPGSSLVLLSINRFPSTLISSTFWTVSLLSTYLSTNIQNNSSRSFSQLSLTLDINQYEPIIPLFPGIT